MVEGDFRSLPGKWYTEGRRPKPWLPIRLTEGRLCNEIKTKLSCITGNCPESHGRCSPRSASSNASYLTPFHLCASEESVAKLTVQYCFYGPDHRGYAKM